MHVHDVDKGGVFTEITGSQGSGKTSIALSFTDYTLEHHPNEKIFWSECYNAPLQIFKLGYNKCNIMVYDKANIVFRDRNNKLKQLDIPITTFTDFQELYDKAQTGKANVVFFGNRLLWMDFITFLRGVGEWVHIYIDEMGEICPSYQSGKRWKRIGDFSMVMKDIRKCMMNVHTNTQSVEDIDHRIRTKIMIKIFLPGAKTDKKSRITQKAIDNLIANEKYGNHAYLEIGGKFGTTVFSDIYKPNPDFHIEAHNNGGGESPFLIPLFDNGENLDVQQKNK